MLYIPVRPVQQAAADVLVTLVLLQGSFEVCVGGMDMSRRRCRGNRHTTGRQCNSAPVLCRGAVLAGFGWALQRRCCRVALAVGAQAEEKGGSARDAEKERDRQAAHEAAGTLPGPSSLIHAGVPPDALGLQSPWIQVLSACFAPTQVTPTYNK